MRACSSCKHRATSKLAVASRRPALAEAHQLKTRPFAQVGPNSDSHTGAGAEVREERWLRLFIEACPGPTDELPRGAAFERRREAFAPITVGESTFAAYLIGGHQIRFGVAAIR